MRMRVGCASALRYRGSLTLVIGPSATARRATLAHPDDFVAPFSAGRAGDALVAIGTAESRLRESRLDRQMGAREHTPGSPNEVVVHGLAGVPVVQLGGRAD